MKFTSAKKLAGLSVLLIFCFMLAACSDNEANGSGDGGSKDELTITFRGGGGSNEGLVEWLNEEVIPQFNEEHPDVNVKLSPLKVNEGDYFAKVALLLKSENTAPDLVTEDTFMVNSDASAGYLEPISDKVKGWDEWGNFTENVKAGVIAEDGEIYGVPYNTDSRGLWYNKKVLKEAGVSVPWEPKTWDDILAAAKAVKKNMPKDVVPLWMNSGKATGEATSMQTFEMLLYGTGDPLYDQDKKKWIVKSDGLSDTFKFIDQVYEQDLGPDLSKALNGQGGTIAYQQLMPQGKLGIGLDGIWQAGTWREGGPAPWPESDKDLGFAAMPTQNGQDPGTTSMSGGWALSIPSKSNNKDLAWEFIKMASTKENNLNLQLKDRSLTPREDVAEEEEYQQMDFFEEASAYLENTHFRPAVDKYPRVSTVIQTLVENVVTDKLTPEQAADQYKKEVTDIVGADKVVER
ncbi:extracellular solute-binding protein [Halobacillus salinarum]|uniref:Extracellular solute-binding protein n=1 Tax=Halobacillus salinarum TaxID=2932257 RepID=A0ABY4EN64_9BACI|nr:extracellular solute-binding protein [Halobacillus salinarum]UOQ45583.1 extracellular solute-binding protein [Halobacillus salinarum]